MKLWHARVFRKTGFEEFFIGDIVCLQSGSPKMTVISFDQKNEKDAITLTAIFWDYQKLCFEARTLPVVCFRLEKESGGIA